MKAIETRYKGYRFRSRLEARWAVFFDTMGLRWEYEPQGYVGRAGVPYLPDFQIQRDVYVEIKPPIDETEPGIVEKFGRERIKWGGFCKAVPNATLLIIYGVPGYAQGTNNGNVYHADHTMDRMRVLECRRCGAFAWHSYSYVAPISPGGLGSWSDFPDGAVTLCGPECDTERWPVCGEKIQRAVAAARGARFEHGEQS